MIKNVVVEAARAARTRADVARLEVLLRQHLDGAQYRYMGDNPGNWSSVTSGAEPTALIFERVTNMFDALIEYRSWKQHAPTWQSPADAVADLYGLPDGVDALSDKQRAALAEDAVMVLHDSDDSVKAPTITFRDRGTGLTGAQMPDTILSLNRSPKLGSRYAHGVFGKGGTTASQYSDATIIVTRRQPEMLQPDEEDRVSVAVLVKGRQPDFRMPFLHYLVNRHRHVYSIQASEAPDFEPGTYISHIGYQLGQAGVETWKHDQSVYAYAETVLFRPVMPYGLHDARTGDANVRPDDRQKASTVAGLGRRLDKATSRRRSNTMIDHSPWSTITVPDVGTVRLRWWLFEDDSARRRLAARRFSVCFVSNGQTHHSWDQQRLQTLVEGRKRVGSRLLVEVDCDAVDVMKRVELFTSDRNAMRSGSEGRALEAQVVEALSGDPALAGHEEDLVRRALKTGPKGVTAAFLESLNKAIKNKTKGIKVEAGDGPKPPPPPPPPPVLYPEPTYLDGPEDVKGLLGKHARIYLRANAVNGFVPDRATLTVTPEQGAPTLAPNIGALHNGRMRVSLQVPPDAQPGTYMVNFRLTWISNRGGARLLQWDTKVEIVRAIKPRTKRNEKLKPSDDGQVAFVWTNTREQDEWTDADAGDLQYLPGSVLADREPKVYGSLRNVQNVPTVLLNQDFKEWAAYRTRVITKHNDRHAEVRTHRYGVALGSAVASLYREEDHLQRVHEEGKDGDAPMTPEQRRRALARTAGAILVVLPDLDVVRDSEE